MFDAVSAVSNLVSNVVTRIWPDATETEKAKLALITAEMQSEFQLLLGQIEINKIEAASDSKFKSWWRPFIGWGCGISFLYAGVFEPIARFIAMVIFRYIGEFPVLDTTITMQVLLGLLGLAGMRTYEKNKNINGR